MIGLISGASPAGSETANITSSINANAGNIFVGQNELDANSPRAYLNYILFDKDFDYVDAGFAQVTNDTINDHQRLYLERAINEAGFIYVYVSNESNTAHDVYFDDLRLTHTKSKVLQEDHYYPFGMNIQALSSNAPLSKPNRYKFNGNEEQTDFDWAVYDFNARGYDASLGRFMGVDPLADIIFQVDKSPYQFGWNNPILFYDPSGECPCFAIPWLVAAIEALTAATAVGVTGYAVYEFRDDFDFDRSKLRTETRFADEFFTGGGVW
ncbi:RHS repeat domain-containing protein [Roseivirga sp.]|uniref:RHS repeat domain-containing protein n=1 Tax=Roseivirga sp. TaxID=1964215 RepID=UPI003B52AA14